MQRELILSISIFVLSCVGSIVSYYSILKHTVDENTLASGITPGRHNYTVHESGNCIGWANYELVQKNDISEIKMNQNPHMQVKFTLESVSVLLQEKEDW